jgi:hypothetical protein
LKPFNKSNLCCNILFNRNQFYFSSGNMFGGIVNDNIYLVILEPNVMKLKILILIAGVAGLASCGPAYRVTDHSTVSTDTIGVPSEIKSSFSTQYPTATNVVWTTYDASATPLVDWDLNGWLLRVKVLMFC